MITQEENTVKGKLKTAVREVCVWWGGSLPGDDTSLFLYVLAGALLASMGTHSCHMGASVGPAPALKALRASGILLLLATGMGTPNRLCATAGQATQVSG